MDERDATAGVVASAVAGDVPALTSLLTALYGELIERIGRRIPADLRGQLGADDIVQEAYIAVFRHVTGFKPQNGTSFERWVQTIGLHKLRKAIRARRSSQRGGGCLALAAVDPLSDSMTFLLNVLESPGRTPSGSVARLEAIDLMRVALEQLPDDYRQAVQMVYVQGVPVHEAAAAMQRTERAIYNLCFKAKEHLRGLMASRSHYLSSTS